VEYNPAAEAMFGHSRADAHGRPVAELVIPPAHRAARREGLKRVVAGGPPGILGQRVELTAIRADGSEFPVELTVTQTSDAPPRFTAWVRDLSERKALEAQLVRRTWLLDRAEEIANLGSWAWTPETGEVLWTDNMFRLVGVEPGSAAPSVDFMLERTHPDDREKLRNAVTAAQSNRRFGPLEWRGLSEDGSVRHLRGRGAVEETHGPAGRLIGTVLDVTQQQRAERNIAAHLAVSEALLQWDSLERGGERLLAELGEALDCSVGTLWLPERGLLHPRVIWTEPSLDPTEFGEATKDLRLPRGIGLPGRAWEQRKPIGLKSVVGDDDFIRRFVGEKMGLADGLAFPALAGEEVMAVVELFTNDQAGWTGRLLKSLTGIGYELGAFLARRRGDLKPCPLTPREIEVLRLAAEGLTGRMIAERLVVTPSTVKTHLEHIYSKLGVADRASAVAHGLREGLID
jgi:PAS domain S-box-containing protein